jgi:uncharacterized damage-inducible protein DinB
VATNDIAPPESAAELIERVRVAWEALSDVVAGLSEAELARPGPQGWAVKDHLAHVAEWERATTYVLQGRPQSEVFGLDAATLERMDIDALNDILYQRHRASPVAEVLEFGRQAHAELLSALHRLSDADLRKTIAEYGSDPTDQRPLLEKIAGDTYAHYADHQVWIGELLEARK